jgi:hypothetical protein
VGYARPAVAQFDQQRAQSFFNDARALCERDGGRLWGVSLCGPMVIGDRSRQNFATSQPPPDAPRPAMIGFVNAPIEWGGATWVAYSWEDLVSGTPQRRNEILLHELFHRVQRQLGLAVSIAENEHLDVLDGRYCRTRSYRTGHHIEKSR